MTRPLVIPRAQADELVLTGSAITTAEAARCIMRELDPADMYDVRLRQLVEATTLVDDIGPWYGNGAASMVSLRIGALAVLANDEPAYVRDVATFAVIVSGDPSPWVLRVQEAACRRRTMHAAAEVFNRLGAGADLAGVQPLLEQLAAVGATA